MVVLTVKFLIFTLFIFELLLVEITLGDAIVKLFPLPHEVSLLIMTHERAAASAVFCNSFFLKYMKALFNVSPKNPSSTVITSNAIRIIDPRRFFMKLFMDHDRCC
jgi:hypothetical protein